MFLVESCKVFFYYPLYRGANEDVAHVMVSNHRYPCSFTTPQDTPKTVFCFNSDMYV